LQISENFYTFAGKCHSVIIKPSLMELSNFNKQMEQSIIATIEGKLTRLPFIKAGINRLLYPKVRNKNALKGSNACIISDKDRLDDTVMCFCEYVFFHYGIFKPISRMLLREIFDDSQHFFDSINRRFDSIKNKYFATFDGVHEFCLHYMMHYEPCLEVFGFSPKTLIEIREILMDDLNQWNQKYGLAISTGCSISDAFEISRREAISEASHRRFVELIKRENYPPLFFAVLIFNYVNTYSNTSSLLEPVFIKNDKFDLGIWPVDSDAKRKVMDKAQEVIQDDFQELFQNKQYFSDCKFMGWVDDWIAHFDSFEKFDDFAISIRVARSNFLVESHNASIEKLDKSLLHFLAKRGWKVPGINSSLAEQQIDTPYLENFVRRELEYLATVYSIVHDILSEESRATINWLLERTHYNTIFNKLVEDFTTKYLDKGQEQTTLQESGSSAIETSNETEQQNSPVIVIDKDETHKKWFVRVHEKKINAQPDEWNKKLYACLDALYDSLVKKGLMCESSKKELFIYRFSGFNIPEPFNPQEKIRWEGENVLLGYLVRCLITYTGTRAKGLGTVATFFESKRGKNVNLATADYISKEKFNQTPNMYTNLSLAVEILKECGFDEVEATSTRIRDK